MPKYYVKINPLNIVIQADAPREAVKTVLTNNVGRGIMVGPYAEVSVSGFFNDWLFSSDELLREIYDENWFGGVYNKIEEKYVMPSSIMPINPL